MRIELTSLQFKKLKYPHLQGPLSCFCSWNHLVWAAITVGKQDRAAMLRHGRYSQFEIVSRTNLIYANLQEKRLGAVTRLTRSPVYNSLDPTEKSGVSYTMGCAMSKLMASRYLQTPWLMHLDVYAKQLKPDLAQRRGKPCKARPDLVGLNLNNEWIVIEAKGRTGAANAKLLNSAKKQTKRLQFINGQTISLRVALAAHFESNVLAVTWRDPEEVALDAPSLALTPEEFVASYYRPFIELLGQPNNIKEEVVRGIPYLFANISDADMTLGLDMRVIEASRRDYFGFIDQWRQIQAEEIRRPDESKEEKSVVTQTIDSVGVASDGILIRLGSAWDVEQMARNPEERQ